MCISEVAVIDRLFAIYSLLDRGAVTLEQENWSQLSSCFLPPAFRGEQYVGQHSTAPQLFAHFGVSQSSVLVTIIQQLLSTFRMLLS